MWKGDKYGLKSLNGVHSLRKDKEEGNVILIGLETATWWIQGFNAFPAKGCG